MKSSKSSPISNRAIGFLVFLAALLFTCFVALAPANALATTTKIGNGDEGTDLEGAIEIKDGKIFEAKKFASDLLRSLSSPGVPGLGMLLPEVEGTQLYLTKKDSQAIESTDQGSFHADMKGRVYARTFAEPHAATRFFPVATKLDTDQLIALHIHEGLHRSLPANIREDENVVSGITLAITTPGANFDSIKSATARLAPSTVAQSIESPGAISAAPMPETARAKNPSLFGYEYRSYRQPNQATAFQVDSMHVLKTELYPFSLGTEPLGLGMEFSVIKRPRATLMGPLQLSARLRVWSHRGFDVGLWAVGGLNTLSNDELKQSQFGRDTFQVGISIKKDLPYFSVENFLSYMIPGRSNQKTGNVNYLYEYGSVIGASTHPAFLLGGLRVGGFFEMLLGDYYRVSGGAFSYDPGRYRLVSAGPEIQYRIQNVAIGLSARYLIDSSKDASYDSLGDLMGPGVAQGNIVGSISIYF